MIEHFGVDLEGELPEIVKHHNEITCAVLNKIDWMKVNDDHWIHQILLSA